MRSRQLLVAKPILLIAVTTFPTTALLSKSVAEHPVTGRASGSQNALLWILSWLALSNGSEQETTNTDLFTLASGKGRQNYGCFLPDTINLEEQPCLWKAAPHSRQGRGSWEAEAYSRPWTMPRFGAQ